MKRTALYLALLAGYAAFFGRGMLSEGPERLDPVGPQAHKIEEAIAEGRFADAAPLANEARRFTADRLLTTYWLALINRGLNRPEAEAQWWENFTWSAETCPEAADAQARVGDAAHAVGAYARCASLDRDNPERLIDLAEAYKRAGRSAEALDTYRKAATLDPRNPTIAHRVARLTDEAGASR